MNDAKEKTKQISHGLKNEVCENQIEENPDVYECEISIDSDEKIEETDSVPSLPENNSPVLALVPQVTDNLQQYIKKVMKIPSLTKEEELELAIAYIEKQDLKAAHKLILSHLKLVVKIALSYKSNSPVMDMISEGNLGLLKAVDKFNPNFGYRLSTYAMWWIKATIQDYILKSWSAVKTVTNANQKKLFLTLIKLKKRIANLHISNHPEKYEQIANELNLSIKDVLSMETRINNQDVSLYQKIGYNDDGRETQLVSTIPSEYISQEKKVLYQNEENFRKKIFNKALSTLNERELYIIKARNLSERSETLESLSKKLNISKERVRQIETKSIEKIKNYISSHTDKN